MKNSVSYRLSGMLALLIMCLMLPGCVKKLSLVLTNRSNETVTADIESYSRADTVRKELGVVPPGDHGYIRKCLQSWIAGS